MFLSLQEMQEALQMFSQLPAHRDVDSCIVALLSHGIEGGIYGVDGKLLQVPSDILIPSMALQSGTGEEGYWGGWKHMWSGWELVGNSM